MPQHDLSEQGSSGFCLSEPSQSMPLHPEFQLPHTSFLFYKKNHAQSGYLHWYRQVYSSWHPKTGPPRPRTESTFNGSLPTETPTWSLLWVWWRQVGSEKYQRFADFNWFKNYIHTVLDSPSSSQALVCSHQQHALNERIKCQYALGGIFSPPKITQRTSHGGC